MKMMLYVFGWNSLKWYENGYDEVDAIVDGLTELDNQNIPWIFDRIGEEVGDIETRESKIPCYDHKVYHSNIIVKFEDDNCSTTYEELIKEAEKYEEENDDKEREMK